MGEGDEGESATHGKTENTTRVPLPQQRRRRPINGSKACHAKYAGLCERCVTDEERQEIENDIAGGILKRATTATD